jgi:hypothetical protein
VADVGRFAELKDLGASTVVVLSMYNLLIAGSLVADLLVVGKFADVSAAASLVESSVAGSFWKPHCYLQALVSSPVCQCKYLSTSSRRFFSLEQVSREVIKPAPETRSRVISLK